MHNTAASVIFILVFLFILGKTYTTVSDKTNKMKPVLKSNISAKRLLLHNIALTISLTLGLFFAIEYWALALVCFVLGFYFLKKALEDDLKKWKLRFHWGAGITFIVLMSLFGIYAAEPHSQLSLQKSLKLNVSNSMQNSKTSLAISKANSSIDTSKTSISKFSKNVNNPIKSQQSQAEGAAYYLNKYGTNQPYKNVGYYSPDNIIVVVISPSQADKFIVDNIKNEILNNTEALSQSASANQPLGIDFFNDMKAAQIELNTSDQNENDIQYEYKHLYAEYLSSDSNGNPLIKFFDMNAANGNVISTMSVSR